MKKGFTLLELLVVVAIIGVLSAIVMSSLNTARAKSRDSRRKQDMVQVRTALEIYFNSNGVYPAGGYFISTPGGGDSYSDNGGNWIPSLIASGAISKLPQDPKGDAPGGTCPASYHRAYFYISTNGTGYALISHCGPEGTISATDPFTDPVRSTFSWKVCVNGDAASNDCSK